MTQHITLLHDGALSAQANPQGIGAAFDHLGISGPINSLCINKITQQTHLHIPELKVNLS